MSIILFLIILAVLVLAHEFGHFIVAKKSGIRVDEFAIGFPPKLLSWTKGETRYSLNLLPFGGFVKIYGEDPTEIIENGVDKERSFTAKPKIIQAGVIVAGVFFNLILAWVIFSAGYIFGTPALVDGAPKGAIVSDINLTITEVLKGSPAEISGLIAGDKIIEIGTANPEKGGTPLIPDSERSNYLTPESVQKFIESHSKEKIAVIFKRKGQQNAAIVTPSMGIVEGKPAIGVALDVIGTAKFPWYKALWEGGKTTYHVTRDTISGLYHLIKDAVHGNGNLKSITGPVGIVGLVSDASQSGFSYLINFVALISINLAVLNLLPFPALDGGRLLFVIIEGIFRKPISTKISNALNTAGFVILIGLMLVVTYHDIVRLLVK